MRHFDGKAGGEQRRVHSPPCREQNRVTRRADADSPLGMAQIRGNVRRGVRGIHEKKRECPLRHRLVLIVRSQYRAVVLIKEHDVLRESAAHAGPNFGEYVREIPLSDPVEIDCEPADRFQMLTQGIGIGDPRNNLVWNSGQFGVENGISPLRVNARQYLPPHLIGYRRIDRERNRRVDNGTSLGASRSS